MASFPFLYIVSAIDIFNRKNPALKFDEDGTCVFYIYLYIFMIVLSKYDYHSIIRLLIIIIPTTCRLIIHQRQKICSNSHHFDEKTSFHTHTSPVTLTISDAY